MRISVERLRIGLLVGAGLLIVAIAAFLGYARYRIHREIANLPGRLGATITRESNGYTYSQSDGKNTVFTIHAAKAVEHTDGKYTLRDVQMVLYGHKGDRADRISGNEFEYDTKEQVVRAVGLVHIDLAAPVAQGARESEASKHLGGTGASAGVSEEAGAGSRVIHVTTSGLVYVRKLATAATDQGIEFAFGGFTGHAVGAEYNSDSGHLVLQSAVTVSGLDRGKPIALAASHGELDRESDRADFKDARYSSAGEVAQAEMAHLHMRPDGTIEGIEGVGRVVLEGAGQGRATSDRADVSLDAMNKPKSAVLSGNVKFDDDEAFRQERGDSQSADLTFDEHGRIERAVLHGGVHTFERLRASDDAKAPWSERTLTADNLDLALVAEGAAGKAQLREAKATGSAKLNSVSTVLAGAAGKTGGKKAGTTTDILSADALEAHFVDAGGKTEISTVHGAGHTVLDQAAPGDVKQISRGETLDVRFREVTGTKGSVEVASAVQEGGVVIDRSAPAKAGPVEAGPAKTTAGPSTPALRASVQDDTSVAGLRTTQHAVARRASYDADSDKLTLTDGVQMSDEQSTIWAAKVVMDRVSGDATAEGEVKVTYLQRGPAEPVHVVAARAELNNDAGRATFYGRPAGVGASGTGLARMWQAATAKQVATQRDGPQQEVSQQEVAQQGGSQIEAPVLVFEQESKRLTARAERPGVLGAVHTVLTSARPGGPGGADTKARAVSVTKPAGGTVTHMDPKTTHDGPQQTPVRITSSEMVYSDEQRQAVFSGGVRLVDADGEMRAQEATVFLTPAEEKGQKNAGVTGGDAGDASKPSSGAVKTGIGMLGGQVERIVATQHIKLTQPGRLATGERLVYTAADQMFVLTGTSSNPPKVVDDAQGSTTGAMLRFHSGDDSVSVLGSDGAAPARKVHTETHIVAGARKQ